MAKILSETGDRVLIVDCDGQYDSFKFFTRCKNDEAGLGIELTHSLTLVGNKVRKSLKSLHYEEGNYDYIVLDADASMTDTIKNILQNEIKLVIVPVNDQANAIENMDELFQTVAKLHLLDNHFSGHQSKEDQKSVAKLPSRLLPNFSLFRWHSHRRTKIN